jgi:hypothetical protein
MPFAKRGDVVHSEATSGFNNQKKSLLINGLAALGDSHHPLQIADSPSLKTRSPPGAAGFFMPGSGQATGWR